MDGRRDRRNCFKRAPRTEVKKRDVKLLWKPQLCGNKWSSRQNNGWCRELFVVEGWPIVPIQPSPNPSMFSIFILLNKHFFFDERRSRVAVKLF